MNEIMSKRLVQMTSIQSEAFDLFVRKNQDYGDAFAIYGTIGVLVRLQDKISRALKISNSQINLVESENLRDTLIDLHNYAAMAIMLIDDTSTAMESVEVYPGDYNGKKRKRWLSGRWFTDNEMLEDSKPNAWE